MSTVLHDPKQWWSSEAELPILCFYNDNGLHCWTRKTTKMTDGDNARKSNFLTNMESKAETGSYNHIVLMLVRICYNFADITWLTWDPSIQETEDTLQSQVLTWWCCGTAEAFLGSRTRSLLLEVHQIDFLINLQ